MKLRRLKRYLNLRDVKKYLHYLFGVESFRPDFDAPELVPALRETARRIRGAERGSAIMIHGILPRAGTVYVGQLLRLHPDLHALAHNLSVGRCGDAVRGAVAPSVPVGTCATESFA